MVTTPGGSIRQLDWRFLLPAPHGGAYEHLLLLGGPPDLESAVIELGVARRVSRRLCAADPADAAVVLAGARESIDEIAPQLADDAALYWEVDRRRPGSAGLSPARAAARLRRHRLTPVNTFWVKPGFPGRQMYLPLEARGALNWYLRTIYRTTSLPRRILKTALGTAATHPAVLGGLVPCHAITATKGPRREPALVDELRRHGLGQDARVEPVLLASGLSEWNRVALLLFEGGGAAPAAVVKLPRQAAFNHKVEWEHQCLRELAATLDPRLAESLPSSTLFRWNDLSVSIETCVPGASLHSRAAAGRADAIDDVRLAAGWLADFHRRTATGTVAAREWLTERLLRQQVSEYAGRYGLTPAEARMFERLSRQLQHADAGRLPLVWQHADFGPWNVYRDGERLSVIDWEIARRGPALVDLLYLVAHWNFAGAGSESPEECCRQLVGLFCDAAAPDPIARASRAHIAEYMRRVGLAPALLPVLLVYTFVEQALECARRLCGVAGANPSDRRANCYTGYLDALAGSLRWEAAA